MQYRKPALRAASCEIGTLRRKDHGMKKLAGKVALVTGASKGIGLAIARALARDGARVVVNYASDREGAEKVAAEIGGTAFQANVARAEDVTRMLDSLERLDIIVNNAGIFAYTPLASVTEADIDRLYATNVKGVLLVTQAALAKFPETGGSIVNVSALSASMPSAGLAPYAGTKAALDAITHALAKELGPRQIRVNGVRPGLTLTDGLRAQGVAVSAFEARAIAGTPLGRAGLPEDIADVVAFLASDDARWVTGSVFDTAGGLTY